jgi:hypothetical protein
MKKILIHVGTPKTGSSYLQRKLNANRIELNNNGFDYRTGNEPNNRKLTNKLKTATTSNEIIEIFSSHISKSAADTIILSDEVFANIDTEIIRCISGINEFEFLVCCFVRSPASYAESAYKQWFFKNPKFENFNDFLNSWHHPNWCKNLDVWQSNGAKVKIYPYVPNNCSIDSQFLNFIEHDINLSNKILKSDKWGANPSLNRVGLNISKKLSQLYKLDNHKIQMFLLEHGRESCFSSKPSTFSLMSEELIEIYNKKNEKLIREIETKFCVNIYDELIEHDLKNIVESNASNESDVLIKLLASCVKL